MVTSYQTSPRPGAKTNPVWLIGILCIHSLVQALADKTWQVSSCKQTAFLVWSWLFWQLSCEILYTSVAGIKAIRTPRFLIYETAYADWNLLLYSLFLRKWSLHCCCWAFLHRVDWGPFFKISFLQRAPGICSKFHVRFSCDWFQHSPQNPDRVFNILSRGRIKMKKIPKTDNQKPKLSVLVHGL